MEVDTVLATHELLELFGKLNIDFMNIEQKTNNLDEEMKSEDE